MPRYNVEYNGKWACFSSVVDGFITGFLNKSEYEKWRELEYGRNNYRQIKECNMKTMKEAAFSIRLNRTHEEAVKCMLECGLTKSECEQIIYDMETEYYCPIPKDNGKYECPNCHDEVEKNQEECLNYYCCLEFVWRDQEFNPRKTIKIKGIISKIYRADNILDKEE